MLDICRGITQSYSCPLYLLNDFVDTMSIAVLPRLTALKAFKPVEDFHPLSLNAFGFMPAVAVVDQPSAFPAGQLAINED